MQHFRQKALVPPARHARLFELIRQETLAAARSHPAEDQTQTVSDYLQKAAAASLCKPASDLSP